MILDAIDERALQDQELREMSKFIGCSTHIQQPGADSWYSLLFQLINAAALWLRPQVMHFDVSQDVGGKVIISLIMIGLVGPGLIKPK